MMETLFNGVSLALLAVSMMIFGAIVRDAIPHLDEDDRASLRTWTRIWSKGSVNRAIGNAWKAHERLYPQSRKRVLFASFLIASCLSVMGYPLWLAHGH